MKTGSSVSHGKLTKMILLIILGLQCSPLLSQNYIKEVWEEMDNTDRFSNLMKLSQLQGIYPGRAIIYFLMGNIYDEYMREADPLVMYDVVSTNYYQFSNHYSLLKLRLDEKQANQDREYFGTVEIITDKRKVHLEDILHEIEKRKAGTDDYFKNATNVHENYVKCITKYNECLFRFRDITRAYPDIKTLYLMTDQRLQTDFERLSINFDSVLVYFNAYKEACKKIPSLQKINDYQLNKITTYRLEGLTEANFYEPVVRLWDYAAWANQFINTLKTDIAAIRSGIEASDKELSEQTEKLKREPVYYDSDMGEPGRDKLYYLTGKYDYASITNDLLNYRKYKLNYLSRIRSEINDPGKVSEFDLSLKLMFYKSLADAITALNEKAERLKKRISAENTSKYHSFFFDRFKGMEGFARWCEMEKSDNNQVFENTLSNLDQFHNIAGNLYQYRDSNLMFNRKKLAFGVQVPPATTVTDTLITRGVVPFQKRWFFLNGWEYPKKGARMPFLAKVNPEGKTEWMVTPLPKGTSISNASYDFLQVTIDSSCWTLGSATRTFADSSRIPFSFLTVVNWKGKTINSFLTDSARKPVCFWVDDINEQYLTITEGTTDQLGFIPLKIKLFNFNNSLVWEHSLRMKGEFGNTIVTNSDFYITLSCSALDLSTCSVAISLPNGQSEVAGIYIRRDGSISHINEYKIRGELRFIGSEKVYDNTLQIFAEIIPPDRPKSYLYLLTDKHGHPFFTNDTELLFETRTIGQ